MLRKLTKKICALSICLRRSRWNDHLVVASTGRAGSTLLFEALISGYVASRANPLGKYFEHFARRVVSGYKERVDTFMFHDEFILKTHDINRGYRAPNLRYIFIYGDPLESVASVDRMVSRKGKSWFYRHQRHLGGRGSYSERYERDVLNYEGQINSWVHGYHRDVLVLRYDEIWDRKEDIESFVGFTFELPERQPRSEKTLPECINYSLFDYLKNLDGVRSDGEGGWKFNH